MQRTPARRAAVLLAALALATGGACSSDDDATETAGTTEAPTTSTTAAPTTTTAAPTTTSTAAPATTSTTEAEGPVVLRLDGVGPATVGMGVDEAVAALTGALGASTELRPWVQPSCELAGPGTDGARSAVWDGLVVTFRGPSEGEATLAGWTYSGGPVGDQGPLVLDTGVGVGDSGDGLRTRYGSAATFVSFDVFDPHWEVARDGAVLWAIVDADAPGATITRMDLNPQLCE